MTTIIKLDNTEVKSAIRRYLKEDKGIGNVPTDDNLEITKVELDVYDSIQKIELTF